MVTKCINNSKHGEVPQVHLSNNEPRIAQPLDIGHHKKYSLRTLKLKMQNQKGDFSYVDTIDMLAYYIANIIIPANPTGFTFDPRTLETPVFGNLIFLVSLKGYEHRFYTKPGLKEVTDWIRRNNDLLSRPGHFIGGWQHNGVFYLDITISIRGMLAALNAAYAHQQIAIYHPFSGESFYLPKAA